MSTDVELVDELVDAGEIVEAIRDAITSAMPTTEKLLEALTPPPLWTPLPPGSHLRADDGRRGHDVVALRSVGHRVEVITDRGAVVVLANERRLHVGRTASRSS